MIVPTHHAQGSFVYVLTFVMSVKMSLGDLEEHWGEQTVAGRTLVSLAVSCHEIEPSTRQRNIACVGRTPTFTPPGPCVFACPDSCCCCWYYSFRCMDI